MIDKLDLLEQVITCERCELAAQCTSPVFMTLPVVGSVYGIAVVGEAPGAQEDEQGAPFVGPSGKLLRELLTEVSIHPAGVAFVNTVSCFPHGTPTWDQLAACEQNKNDQLALADVRFVLTVGKVALKGFRRELDVKHGRSRPWMQDGRLMFATYHPAAALRNGNYEDVMRDDLRLWVEMMAAVRESAGAWARFIPDNCASCRLDVTWLEESGLGWCDNHIPDRERPRMEAWRALQEQDYLDAKARLGS